MKKVFIFLISLVLLIDIGQSQDLLDSTIIKPIMGYRFQIVGDFDGNFIQDTLCEVYYNHRDKIETNKYYTNISDINVLYDSAEAKVIVSYVKDLHSKIDTLFAGGILGLLFMKNEGDLDGDGTDEVSIVNSYPQTSSVNECQIMSYKKGKWVKIYSFEIREWQIPTLPSGGRAYGLFGVSGTYSDDLLDSANLEFENSLKTFGFIKRLGNKKIKISTFATKETKKVALGESIEKIVKLK